MFKIHIREKIAYYFSVVFSADTLSKSDLNYFLSCVYDLIIGEKKRSFFIPYFLFFHL